MEKIGLFEVYGMGSIGLKAEDLNQYAKAMTECGFLIPEGIVIATGVYEEFVRQVTLAMIDEMMREINLNGKLDYSKQSTYPEFIERMECPDFLLSRIDEILNKLSPDKPYAIRSSEISESGGIGVYKTEFFWPSGNREGDLKNLWRCIASVYASENSKDAEAWRNKTKINPGMAILIMPVVGFRHGDYFMPAISGTAYTSYRGQPTVRVVPCLGTKAVGGGGRVYHKKADYFDVDLWKQNCAHAITPRGIEEVEYRTEELFDKVTSCQKAFDNFFGQLENLKKRGNFYLEWVAVNNQIYIVQCAICEDRLPGNYDFDGEDYVLLLESRDLVNSGRVTCKSIVYVLDWDKEIQLELEKINKESKDYLLIIPSLAISKLTEYKGNGKMLSLCHFSNALAVVEHQIHYDDNRTAIMLGLPQHSGGMGATHFSGLCTKTNILYIGAEFDTSYLNEKWTSSDGIVILDIEAEVLSGKDAYVYLKK